MLKYLKEFREHKNIVVETSRQEYRVFKLEVNKLAENKEEIHIKMTTTNPDGTKKETLGVISLYNFKLRKNRLRNKLDGLLRKSKTLSVYVVFTSDGDMLNISLRPLLKNITTVQALLNEVKAQFNAEVELSGKYINPPLDSPITNYSDLTLEELTNQIRITGY